MSDVSKKQITVGFNVLMFIYLCFDQFAEYLFEPENPAKAPWEVLFENSPAISIVLALIFALALIIAGSYLLRLFWNWFITDVFKVRDITFQEAMSILLIAVVALG